MPAIYNDLSVCTALEAIGIPPSDAHLYCMNGCNQIDIFGKSHMGLEDGEISVIKALEFALFRGVCQFSMEQLAPDTGDPTTFASFKELMAAYKKQIEYMADYITETSNRAQEIFAKDAPNPWKSIMVQGCIEKGLDYKDRGPIYGHGQVLTEGLPDTADSLAAIKHFIYDTKKYTMAELIDALSRNFEGYEALWRDFSGYDKFGNDIDEVDTIYGEISDHIYRYFQTKKTFRGGVFGVGCSTFHRAPNYGFHCGALPNGKKRGGKLLADSIGATPGNDVKGPTALLKSVMHGNQYLATSGNVLQIKVARTVMNLGDTFDFKWADNSVADGNVMQFLDQGDAAPNDRFNYRYTTVQTEVKLPDCLAEDMIVLKAGSYNAFAGGKQVRLDASSTKAVLLGRGSEFYLPKAFVETVIGVSCEGLTTYDHYGITYVMPAEAITAAGKAVTISEDGLVVIHTAAVEDKDVLITLYRALM
jgi:hypothetical protein